MQNSQAKFRSFSERDSLFHSFNNSPLTLHYSPATTILNENPDKFQRTTHLNLKIATRKTIKINNQLQKSRELSPVKISNKLVVSKLSNWLIFLLKDCLFNHRVFIRPRRSDNSPATTQISLAKFCLFPERASLFHNNSLVTLHCSPATTVLNENPAPSVNKLMQSEDYE